MATANGVNVLEVCHVSPSNSPSEFSLRLTHYDILCIKSSPLERLYFYEFSNLSPAHFLDSVIPSLKNSLSLTLSCFLPVAGSVTWPPHLRKPIIQYTTGDSVSFTVAESNGSLSFDSLSGNDAVEVVNSRPLLPKLFSSQSRAFIIAFQVTLFPNKGFCMGITSHHGVLDGNSFTLFMKAWSHICRHTQGCKEFTSLTPELTPFLERDVIRDPPASYDTLIPTDMRSLKLLEKVKSSENSFRATFPMTREDINKIKKKIITWQQREGKEALHLSTFVVTCAYVLVCLLNASKTEGKLGIIFSFPCDLRTRLNPPLPENYFGNCLGTGGIVKIEDRDLSEEEGLATLAAKISDEIKEIDERNSKDAEWWISKLSPLHDPGNRMIYAAGSPRFEVYGVDLGWGKPKKVDILASVVEGGAGFALNQNKDESGGLEVILVLSKKEMETFDSLFRTGLRMA